MASADLGDQHDQAEEQGPVPLPPVERHDHVDEAGEQRADAGQPGDGLHGRRPPRPRW